MKTEIFKGYFPVNSGIEFWILRLPQNGQLTEHVIGKVDEFSKEEADEIAYDVKKKINVNRLLKEIERENIVSSCPTLKEFSEIYISHAKSYKKSWDRDVRSIYHLNRLLEGLKLTDINKAKVYEYQDNRLKEVSRKNGKPLKPGTINKETDCLRSIFSLAIEKTIFPFRNPLSNYNRLLENNFRKRILSKDEEYKLMSVSKPHMQNIIKCGLLTGMRAGEIVTLKWDNIDLNSGFILLEGKNTKNGKPRDIVINQSMRRIFEEIKISNTCEKIIFLNSRQKPYATPDAMKNAFKNALRRAKIENFTFHDLRRTCATRMYENGKDIGIISAILGHSSIEMTKRYLAIDKLKREALESLDD